MSTFVNFVVKQFLLEVGDECDSGKLVLSCVASKLPPAVYCASESDPMRRARKKGSRSLATLIKGKKGPRADPARLATKITGKSRAMKYKSWFVGLNWFLDVTS